MSDPEPVVVVGAGIAGLTLAVALRLRGCEPLVLEADANHRVEGAGIQLAPNAVRLLDRLGLGGELRRRAVAPVRTEIRRWDDGRVLTAVELARAGASPYGAPLLTMHRVDLHRTLLSALPGAAVRLGHRAVGVRSVGTGVELTIADRPPVRARLLVGADGAGSMLRRALSGRQGIGTTGHVIHRCTLPYDDPGEPVVTVWVGPGAHLVTYPIAGGEQLSVAATTRTAQVEPRQFASWAPTVRRYLSAGPEWRSWGVFDASPVGARGPVTFVGDAAHPIAPFAAQGAGQAIEDASVLARCLSTACDSAGLRAYEAARQGRVLTVRRYSRDQAEWLHLPDGPQQRARDAALARSRAADLAWLYAHDPLAELDPGLAV